jgi:hypothetical protein
MPRFCRAHGIRLLLADIPDVSGSVLLEPYDGAAETHVPHGDRAARKQRQDGANASKPNEMIPQPDG